MDNKLYKTIGLLGMVTGLSIYMAWQMAYASEDNQTNPIEKLFARIDANSIRFIDNQTAYMCIQVDKNDITKVCKYWNDDELRTWMLSAIKQEDISQYLLDLLTKNLQQALNKTRE